MKIYKIHQKNRNTYLYHKITSFFLIKQEEYLFFLKSIYFTLCKTYINLII